MPQADRTEHVPHPQVEPTGNASLRLNDIISGLLLAEADKLRIELAVRMIQTSPSVCTFIVTLGGASFTVTTVRWS